MQPIRQLLLLLLLLFCTFRLVADERILSFQSTIHVQTDGSLMVEEQIQVRAEGKSIKRGIYRDFPTKYRDRRGNQSQVGFDLLDVRRDDQPEPHHTQNLSNGIRIYAGEKNTLLPTGVYTYTLRYRTTRQLGFFEQHDELYWNVTGNDWSFPIDQASAQVFLPAGIDQNTIHVEGYTGLQGGRGQDYIAQIEYDGSARFSTTRTLGNREGLTIVVTWPKGFVDEPSETDRLFWFLNDNRDSAIGLIGTLLLLAYYFFSWNRVGRDPELGVVIPEYTPPEHFSPASLRFIRRMGYDKNAFSAAIVNMAVAGYLRIIEDDNGIYTLERVNPEARLAAGERAIAKALFKGVSNQIVLKQSNHQKLREAIEGHKAALKRDYEIQYFRTNSRYLIPGYLITILTLILAILSIQSEEKKMFTGFISIWLSIWSFAVFKMLTGIWLGWRNYRRSGKGLGAVIFSTLFALPFLGGELAGITLLLTQGSLAITLMILALATINYLFYEWMKAPTKQGQEIRRRTEGFTQYLSIAEKDELALKHPPEKTPELFERYLPYAIALEVEQQWGDKFSRVLTQAGSEAYRPGWYQGNGWNAHNIGGFTGSVGTAMGSAIASASTAPGSSSGSGGGGSSGGGGGGGGGGGW